MAFTKQNIEKLAQLARIDLTDSEKGKFSEQISSILAYVKQIEEVDTANVKSTDHHGGLKNVFRQDEVAPYSEIKKLISQFPEKYGNLNKVKQVFE